MKQIILLVAMTALILTSCKDDNKKRQKWDANAMISLRAAQGVKAEASNPKHLTPLEIVKQASIISYRNKNVNNGNNAFERGFDDHQRDFANQRLLMFGTDIIGQYGDYVPDFIEGDNVIFVVFDNRNKPIDTIAYIPNKTITDARNIIQNAYNRGDYDIVYATFDKAFTFVPITGEEWRALKAEGKN